jgi:hypothetical protein
LLTLCLIRPIHTEQPDKDKSALGFGSAALKRPSANAGDSALLPRITTPAIEAASGEALELDAASDTGGVGGVAVASQMNLYRCDH